MRIFGWNVNGLRAAARKGFEGWLGDAGADVVALQEVRALPAQVDAALSPQTRDGWEIHLAPAEKKGYSGVGLFSRVPPDRVVGSTGDPRFDVEGRTQIARFGDLHVVNTYVPNAGPGGRRLGYKAAYTAHLRGLLQPMLDRGDAILVVGDFNVAHQPIDLSFPERMEDQSGYRPPEREDFGRWLDAGWTDTFRHAHPGEKGHYTWWNARNALSRRHGWRFDYILASPAAMAHVVDVGIHREVFGSDHCPVSVTLDDSVLG